MGWERSVLGYPVTDETPTPDHIGQFNHFSKNGSIYWTPTAGAWEIHGDIRTEWAKLGWERSVLGYPVTDQGTTADKVGHFTNFSSTRSLNNVDGSIYWTPTTGAHDVYGAVRAKWIAMGAEQSCLGYPISDATGAQGTFQRGVINVDATSGQATSSC